MVTRENVKGERAVQQMGGGEYVHSVCPE